MFGSIVYSDIDNIDALMRSSIDRLALNHYELKEIKNINYGTRYKFKKDDLLISFTIYYSSKKGISIVKDQNVNQPNFDDLISFLCLSNNEKKLENRFNKWIGTDEAGKGDYFGPLVVAGFLIKKAEIEYFKSLGIKDSKRLSDKDVDELFILLNENFSERICFKTLLPYEYNKTIYDFKRKGQTLNDLLGILHSQVIIELYNKFEGIDGIITDQFTHQDKVFKLIKNDVRASYVQRIGAESDIAVAAASVIARAVFLRELDAIGKEFNIVFPKGASDRVVNWALEFYKNYGENNLSKVAKIHFKTTNTIKNLLGRRENEI
ncbi:MAG: ribonuclease HIII [Firmicutes bacterium]|nr:ribonuclease HIII [Bacillota bacterium]